MRSAVIFLNTINDVKTFVATVSKYDFPVDLISGRYSVDAKSIMGIFSLDLSKPVKLEAQSSSEEELKKFFADIKPFITE